MLFALVVYFLAAVFLLSLVFFPDLRTSVLSAVQGLGKFFKHLVLTRWVYFHQTSQRSVRQGASQWQLSTSASARFLARRKGLVLAALGLVSVPPMAALALRRFHVFEFSEEVRDPNAQIASLLTGEQLVPPAPLPPEVFLTREVELVRPSLGGASRDWALLDADFRQRLLWVFKLMKEQHGYDMALLEGYRSPTRQAALAEAGPGVITNAGAYQSYHQYGLAADSAFFRDGRLVISEKDPWAMRGYQLYGALAESLGLTWGGRWKLMDFGHVELRRPGVLGRSR